LRAGVSIIDPGTTSTRAIVFDANGAPQPGRVERDSDSLWCNAVSNARDALRRSALRAGGLGCVANQRKTVLIWECTTSQPIGQRHRLARRAHSAR
jgi:glycerol kinase